MATVKLTLSADEAVVDRAKELARERNTSVSAMFARFVAASRQQRGSDPWVIGPVTQQASGLVRLPENVLDVELLTDALGEKYRVPN